MKDDIMICNECGLPFDLSSLEQVIKHQHLNSNMEMEKEVLSKKMIGHARDIFPDAPLDYCIGVNALLIGDYDERYLYQETTEFRLGYFRAKYEELNKTYKLH